ncbi:IQ domain-containing protein H-like isoform X2 [Littorina saxatilis]|uniref:IQ domain-containing protein H-like isoform X2 n=1 Tax=Littorina saxatilis TaxID=31220 RepID=UPI0038B68322
MTEIDTRPEDVGQILVKVQEDLRQLRERFVAKDGQISISDFENALAKTEEGLQRKTEQVVNQMNTRVQTIPLSDRMPQHDPFMAMETTVDLQGTVEFNRPSYMMRQPHPPGVKLPARRSQVKGLTPGQKHHQQWTLRAIFNPQNQQNRPVMRENFGIQLPLINERRPALQTLKPINGTTVDHLTVLPKANRVDPQLAPPPITEDDARKGILSLIERGLIPPAAQLTLDPSPVRHKALMLHDPDNKNNRPISEMATTLSSLHYDTQGGGQGENTLENMPAVPPRPVVSPETRTVSAKTRASSSMSGPVKTPASMKTYEMSFQPLCDFFLFLSDEIDPEIYSPPPTTPASGADFKSLSHRFAIQHGKVRDTQPEFLAFKQHYCLTWGSIVTMLRHLEKMLTSYAVPVGFIHGDRLADLSVEYELEKAPGLDELLSVIVNREDVEAIINKPGRRFMGPNGSQVAATQIQSSWRRYRDRSQYLEYRRLKWAAGVIAISWIMHIKMAKMRKQLRETRAVQLQNFKLRAKKFSSSWDRIKNSKRLVIHIPSLGLTQKIRDSINDFGMRQNTQMARLCDIQDPNVDVIFVSPVPLSDETLQYYTKLLGLSSAVASGEVEDQCDMSDRYKVLVPEAIKSFPTHRMCLSTILKYSPCTLKRISNLTRGRDAYIVTGVPHRDDLAVADYLNVPILSPEPEVSHLYSTKSGCKRIFASANVDIPPSEYDVYSLGQLYECLAQLVTEHLNVKRWLFKLDNEFDGRGIAYCDVTDHLKCFRWAQKEAKRYGDKWNKKWAQEAAYIKIHAEIPDILMEQAKPSNTRVYATWQHFLVDFLSQGGVIEACPPTESITTLTVDMLIEPNGQVGVVCSGDQIHAESQLQSWGLSIPQASVEPAMLSAMCKLIGEACKARGIVGYIQTDFVTFIDPTTLVQLVWALDLRLHYSDSVAMFQLTRYVTQGQFNAKEHTFTVTPPKTQKKQRRRRLAGVEEEEPSAGRYCVMSTRLLHTNLAVVHYSVFFQMCRAHGIGYDIKEKQGTVFTLIDSFNRERLGMITVGDNLQGALATFARNLSVIHQEVSAPNMQGISNFRGAIDDIEGILGTTLQNAEELDGE